MNRFGIISSVCRPTSKPASDFCCEYVGAKMVSVINGVATTAVKILVKHIRVSFILLYSSLEMEVRILSHLRQCVIFL